MTVENFPEVLTSIDDLDRPQVNFLLNLAKKYKFNDIPITEFESGLRPIVSNFFLEPSTRTKNSFAVAIQKLGAIYIDFLTEASSINKGESLLDTLLTLKYHGVNICVIRTNVSNSLNEFKSNPPLKIINGGDGSNEHPTQALLDLMTFMEMGLELNGKTMAIVGDCLHSRVAHSLVKLLPQFGLKLILCGPENFLPTNNQDFPVNVTRSHELDEALAKSDYVYLLRIQKERHKSKGLEQGDYHTKFGINQERLNRLNPKLPIFHPGPANIGVEISEEVMRGPNFFGNQQVINSVYMRMAIIKAMLDHHE